MCRDVRVHPGGLRDQRGWWRGGRTGAVVGGGVVDCGGFSTGGDDRVQQVVMVLLMVLGQHAINDELAHHVPHDVKTPARQLT